MGAYASLLTSAEHPEVSRGLVLVNGAGKFEEVKAAIEGIAEGGSLPEAAKEAIQEVGFLVVPHFQIDCLLDFLIQRHGVYRHRGWSLQLSQADCIDTGILFSSFQLPQQHLPLMIEMIRQETPRTFFQRI